MTVGNQFTPMFEAIRRHDLAAINRLLREKPDRLRERTPFGAGTWLHFAAAEGWTKLVTDLLDKGLQVDEPAHRDGRYPIKDACLYGHVDTVRELIGRDAVLDTSSSARNPLFAAITARSPEIARMLIDAGIDTRVRYNTDTMKDMDAVAFAMMMGPRDIARMIALHNANGDEAAADRAMADGLRIALANTEPVPPGEDVRPS